MLSNLGRSFLNLSLKRPYCSYKPIKRPDLSLLKPAKDEKQSSLSPQSEGKSSTFQETKESQAAKIDLSKQLRSRILATGPISVADYMREVLTHPQLGYYMHQNVFGREGDFITSPEICQIFAELIAIWFVHEWQKLGSPEFRLIEFGPGRGTLMRDILRVLGQLQVIDRHRTTVHLIEISPYLSKLQAECLCADQYTQSTDAIDNDDDDDGEGQKHLSRSSTTNYYQKGETINGKIPIYWHRLLEDVPKGFSFIIAHEFFDALPIYKFQKCSNKNNINSSNNTNMAGDDSKDNSSNSQSTHWKEILIDVANPSASLTEEIEFRYVLSRERTPISSIFQALDDDPRETLEYCLEMERLIDLIANRFEMEGGIGLVIDYGHFGEKTDTFRAFRRHALHDPLKNPGTADLTADVDFRRMKYVAERDNRCICFGPVTQGIFLNRMQGEVRLNNLLKNIQTEEERNHLKSGYEMLTKTDQMGSRFKFLSIFPKVIEEYLRKYPVIGFHG